MSEKKRATPEDAKAAWDALPLPSCEMVRERLIEQGFDVPGRRQIAKWKAAGKWEKPEKPKLPKKHGLSRASVAAAAAHSRKAEESGKAIVTAAAKEMTGNPEATPENLAALLRDDIEKLVREWIDAPSDEDRMTKTVMQAMLTATVNFYVLQKVGPGAIIAGEAEAIGKSYQAISAGLVTALAPIEQIIATRMSKMKTIPQPNGKVAEIITAEEYDPLAESFKAAFGNAA